MFDATICITHKCNMRCVYCYAGEFRNQSISEKNLLQAIDYIFQRGQNFEGVDLGFFGGEVLLEFDLFQIGILYAEKLSELNNLPVRFTITTNGTLLNDEIAEFLLQHNVLTALSVDGTPSSHDKMRRMADGRTSSEFVFNALKYTDLIQNAIMVIDPNNLESLADGVKFLCEEHHLPSISLGFNFSANWTEKALEKLAQQYSQIADYYIDALRNNQLVNISPFDDKIKAYINNAHGGCSFGLRNIAVSVSGKIYPCERIACDDVRTEFALGTLDNLPTEERIIKLAKSTACAEIECSDCFNSSRCSNSCRYVNDTLSGDSRIPTHILCDYEEICCDCADRIAETLYEEQNKLFLQQFYQV